jgi:hypothetical protein
MSGLRKVLAATVFVTAAAFAIQGPAFAGGPSGSPGPANSVLGALAGSEMSSAQLDAIRGQGGIDLNLGSQSVSNAFNDTTTNYNVSASTDGSISGNSITGGSTTGSVGFNSVTNSSGFINQVANTGNAVMINQATAINVIAH